MQDQVWIYPAELAPGWSPGYTLQPFFSVNEIVQEDFFEMVYSGWLVKINTDSCVSGAFTLPL